jgi:hypothetical protein
MKNIKQSREIENIRNLLIKKKIINKTNQVINEKYKLFFGEEFFIGNVQGLTSDDLQRVSINKNGSVKVDLTYEKEVEKYQMISQVLSDVTEMKCDFADFKNDKEKWKEVFNIEWFTSCLYNRIALYSNFEGLNEFILQQANKMKLKAKNNTKNKLFKRAYFIYKNIAVKLLELLIVEKHSVVNPNILRRFISLNNKKDKFSDLCKK